MALTMERRVGIKLGAWTTVKTALAMGLWLVLSQMCWAQDPLNDVHVQPPPPAPTVPVDSKDSKAPDAKAPPAVEGNKALSARPNERMRVDVNLVLVPVTVTDHDGKTMVGLQSKDFNIFDGQTPQEITSFAIEDVPCSIGLVLDASGSMQSESMIPLPGTSLRKQVRIPMNVASDSSAKPATYTG